MKTTLWVGGWLCVCCLLVGGCGVANDRDQTTRITIASTPESGAEILIDHVPYGETPAVIEGLRPGPIGVQLTKEGYKRAFQIIEVPEKPTGPEERFVIELAPRVGYLTIETSPDGATVTLDGSQMLGTTPLLGKKVPVGDHTYTVTRDRYESVEGAVAVEEDYRYRFAHTLVAKPSRLTVLSRPSDALIWINDEMQRKNTPAIFELKPDTYTIAVRAKGYIRKEETTNLEPGANVTLEFKLAAGDVPPGMVLIPAGAFICGMDEGAPDERPKREIFVDAFFMDKYEVTNEEYKAVFPNHVIPKAGERLPVTGVTWDEATAYAKALGKRLPTEAEWEKAARGTDGRLYPWGPVFDAELCNVNTTGLSALTVVGAYRGGASPYGCMDMAGNAYEWTSSWYQAYPGNKEIRADYGQVFRVLRGGSYQTPPFDARCPCRHFDQMDMRRSDYGFRCAKDIDTLSTSE